jgi:hypothetical protein
MAYSWYSPHGEPLTCNEKQATLNAGMQELEVCCRDMLDDALLMGCSQESAKAALRQLIERITPTVKERV